MSAEQNRPVITKELLRELGDWRTEKEGRSLAAAGAVQNWQWEPPILSGTVRTHGGVTINARLKLGARAVEVENLCSCRQARVDGTICAHVLALVFATMNCSREPARGSAKTGQPTDNCEQARGYNYVPLTEAGDQNPILELMILLPLNLPEAWRTGEMRIIMEASIVSEAFRPFDTIPKETTYAVSDSDERILATGRIVGVWLLTAGEFDAFFEALIGHPRVWLGKRTHIEVRGTEARPHLTLDLEPTGEARLQLTAAIAGNLGHWHFDGHALTRAHSLPAGYAPGEHRLSRAEFARFYEREWPALQPHVDATFSANFDQLEFVESPAPLHITLDGGLTGLNLKLDIPAKIDWTPHLANPFLYARQQPVTDAEILAAGF